MALGIQAARRTREVPTVAERGLVIGARIASGTVAAAVAAVTILFVGLVPLPTTASAPRTLTIEPALADQVRVCPGSAMRLGDDAGGATDTAFALGSPAISSDVVDGAVENTRLTSADPAAGAAAAPEVIRAPASDGALVAGAQLQDVDAPDFHGLAAASCTEPNGSIWLVGGATTVGRTTLLLLANPTTVDSQVNLEIFGEEGAVSAPGMTGIDVPAGGQLVFSLAGFAPGLASPVVHVTARGGRVTADLQQSIVRGLDSVGVELVGAGSEPGLSLVVPGVRITDSVGTSRASALGDWQDVGPAIRVAVPGDTDGTATVRVVPEGDDAEGTSFEIELSAGTVSEIPLDAGDQEGEHTHGLDDGSYTVFVDADVPVVAAVRASTAVDLGEEAAAEPDAVLNAPPSDLAWFGAAPALTGDVVAVVPEGPAPLMSLVNPTTDDVTVDLASRTGGADPITVTVPAGGATTVAVEPGSYLVSGAEGLSVSVSYADAGMLAAFVISPARPVAGPVVVHPD
jgi:hypothetical protein